MASRIEDLLFQLNCADEECRLLRQERDSYRAMLTQALTELSQALGRSVTDLTMRAVINRGKTNGAHTGK